MAAIRGKTKVVELLVENNADLNIQDNEYNTAIHYASEYGFPSIVKYKIFIFCY